MSQVHSELPHGTEVLQLQHAPPETSGGLVKTQGAGPTLKVSDSIGLGWS